MLDGSGEATAAVAPAVAFAFLADPRHAGEWFAGAGFETPPRGPARVGLEWSVAQTPGTRRVQPMRMTVYEPPSRFVWETQYRAPFQTNFVFEMACEPAESEPVEGEGETEGVESTRLRFTIRLRPGVVQWASIAAGFALLRRALRERAQKAAERAAEAVLAAPPAGGSGGKGNATGGSPRRKRRRR